MNVTHAKQKKQWRATTNKSATDVSVQKYNKSKIAKRKSRLFLKPNNFSVERQV